MELRSSDTTNYKEEDRSRTKVKATPSTGSDSRTSSGAPSRKTGPSTSSSDQRMSPSRRQMAAKSSSSCENNEHCAKNNSPRESASLHDSTNGQVMGVPGNSPPPASSASAAHSRQRDALLYGFISLSVVLYSNDNQCAKSGDGKVHGRLSVKTWNI